MTAVATVKIKANVSSYDAINSDSSAINLHLTLATEPVDTVAPMLNFGTPNDSIGYCQVNFHRATQHRDSRLYANATPFQDAKTSCLKFR